MRKIVLAATLCGSFLFVGCSGKVQTNPIPEDRKFVLPSAKKEYLSVKYQNPSSTFFCFDGEEYLKNGNMKYWIFGHNHDVIEYKEHNVACICNPLGYYNESGNGKFVQIKQIII